MSTVRLYSPAIAVTIFAVSTQAGLTGYLVSMVALVGIMLSVRLHVGELARRGHRRHRNV